MNRQEALTLLELPPTADSRAIRSALFRRYHQLFSTAQGPAWTTQLLQLTTIRDVLSNQETVFPVQPLLMKSAQVLSPASLPSYVHVLLYRYHQTETIYTLRVADQDLVLAFENEFSARKYIRQLSEEDAPWTECFNTSEILEFCESAGYGLLIVPVDQLVHPPVGRADHV